MAQVVVRASVYVCVGVRGVDVVSGARAGAR